MKRALALLTSVTLLASVFSGCGNSTDTKSNAQVPSASSDKPISIRLMGGWTGPDADTMRSMVDEFNKSQSKVSIDFTTEAWSTMFTKFFADYSSGAPADIIAMHPLDMGDFVEKGTLDPETVKLVGLKQEDYSPAAWDGTLYNGTQYAASLDIHTHGVYYNEDILKQYGYTKPAENGTEFVEMAQKMTIDANGKNATEAGFDPSNIVQYGLTMQMHHHIFFQFTALMQQQGEIPFTQDTKTVDFDDAKAVKALTWLRDLAFKYHVVPVGDKSPTDTFIAQKAAMYIDGPWQMPKLEETDLHWNTAPYPTVFEKPAVWGSATIFAFSKNNYSQEQKQAAADFVKWIADHSSEWAVSGQIPTSKAGLEAAAKLPGREQFIASVANAKLFPAHPKAVEIFSTSASSPALMLAQATILSEDKPIPDIVKDFKKMENDLLKQ